MNENKILRRSGKLTLVAMLVFTVSYLAYNQLKVATTKPELISQSTPTIKAAAKTGLNDSVVAFAMRYLETPYVAAGCSEDGFDCSGFVYYVFKHFNIEVPRSSAGFEHFGKEIPIESVKKGDILLFLSPTRNAIGHIGIVSTANGAASSFIHASSGSEMKVMLSSLASDGYKRRFVKAIRVL